MKSICSFNLNLKKLGFFLIVLFLAFDSNSQCVANFTYSYTPGGGVSFSNTSTYTPGITSFTWSYGDGNTGMQVSPSHTYVANGTYTVFLALSTVTPPFCSSSFSAVVTITNSPCNNQINASFTGTLGLNGTYSVTSTSTGTTPAATYSWNWGDNTGATGASAVHTYSANGWKTVVLQLTDGACYDTAYSSIYVSNVGCSLTASFNYTLGNNGLVNFQSTSTGTVPQTTYSWTFGDGGTGTGIAPNHVYQSNGVYTASLYISNPNGTMVPTCFSSTTTTISIINATCNLNASYTGTAGPNGAYSVTSTSTGTTPAATYSWSWGDGASSTGPNASHTYTQNGGYQIYLWVNDACVDSTVSWVWISNVGCPLVAGFNFTVGNNGQVTFSSTSTGTNLSTVFQWTLGDGGSSNVPNFNHTYLNNGTYWVSLYIYQPNGTLNPTCSSYISASLAINNATCNMNASFTSTAGPNGSYSVTSTSTGTTMAATYLWKWGDGNTSNTPNAAHVYTTNGSYQVKLIVNDLCADSAWQWITISNVGCSITPSFNYTGFINGTVNFSSTSTGTIAGATYTWTYGDGGIGNGPSPSHTYTNNGIYWVSLMVANPNGTAAPVCFTTAIQQVSVNCNLNANFSFTVLPGGVVNFVSTTTGTIPATTYTWDYGDGSSGFGAATSHTYSNGGIHNVGMLVNNGGFCYDSVYQNVNVNTIPCTANSNFTAVSSGWPLLWYASPAYFGNVTAVLWSWGDGSFDNYMYPTHTYSAAGLYNICLSVTVSCAQTSSTCTNYSIYRTYQAAAQMATIQVMPYLPTGLKNHTLQVENKFLIYPNPNNGKFEISIDQLQEQKNIRISIFDILGKEVYNAVEETANGMYHGSHDLTQLPAGSYTVKLKSGNAVYVSKVLIQ